MKLRLVSDFLPQLTRLPAWLMALVLGLFPLPGLQAQDTPEVSPLVYGSPVSGQISTRQPRLTFAFDGLRGEVISIHLQTTSGDLDPVLTLTDAAGGLLVSQDDSRGGRDITLEAITIPETNRYSIAVGRFGYRLGSTSGAFELSIERIGVSSASGSALRYGDSVINNITHMQPQVYYSFHAERGDIINVRMLRDSGDLDAYMQVVNSQALVVADNDDVVGSGSLNAVISSLLMEESGTYVIVATRYGEANGSSTGRFILTLEEASNSGLGNSAQAALPILFNDVQQGTLTEKDFTQYYTFDARQNDLITVRMSRLTGSVDSFVVLADADLIELASDDDGGGGQNAKIESFVIPRDGTYYILATRFDREQGTTVGTYQIELQTQGNAFDGVAEGVQRITYGTTISGHVDDQTPQVIFAFWGVKDDAITVSLNRGDGDLDPTLNILDQNQNILKEDDDSGGGQNARVARYILPYTGLYYLRATRFSGTDGNPNTQGSFILILARVFQ